MKKIHIIEASGKLGRYMIQHALDRVYEVVRFAGKRVVVNIDIYKNNTD
jgi:putative NADH-flavin reductase